MMTYDDMLWRLAMTTCDDDMLWRHAITTCYDAMLWWHAMWWHAMITCYELKCYDDMLCDDMLWWHTMTTCYDDMMRRRRVREEVGGEEWRHPIKNKNPNLRMWGKTARLGKNTISVDFQMIFNQNEPNLVLTRGTTIKTGILTLIEIWWVP